MTAVRWRWSVAAFGDGAGSARRTIVATLTAVSVVGAGVAMSGCTGSPSRPPTPISRQSSASPSVSSDPNRQGPPARWSLTDSAGDWVGVLAGVAVVTAGTAVFGVDRGTGKELWRHAIPDKSAVTIASDLIVVAKDRTSIEVVSPTDGSTVWKAPTTETNIEVYQKAVYTDSCQNLKTNGPGSCTITSYDVRDGHVRWTAPSAIGGVGSSRIGPHRRAAQDSGQYLVAPIGPSGQRYAALNADTGQPLSGRYPGRSGVWAMFAVGGLLVSTDNDPPAGDARCVVSLEAADANTGAVTWSANVFSGQNKNNTCEKSLALAKVQDIIGDGTRIAAVADSGRPQLFDLATGRTVWVGDNPGVPIDADGTSVLVRRYADTGEIALLDFATGKTRWSAPDTKLSTSSVSWGSVMTPGLVAVTGAYKDDLVCVLVYDAASGRQLGQFPGRLLGAGTDWVAVSHSTGRFGDAQALDFITFGS